MTNQILTEEILSKGKIDKIVIRMYRLGTGDFFLLQFKKENKTTFNLMIDCGCIQGKKEDFLKDVNDLKTTVKKTIDLLVVTHEHADHINGFEAASSVFATITFKEVWFAWTESKDDPLANDLRKSDTKIKLALLNTSKQLTKLMGDKYYESLFQEDHNSKLLMLGMSNFIESFNALNELNYQPTITNASSVPTMEDILRQNKVIKDNTKVEFYEPGKVIENLEGALGIRFFILGPPRSQNWLNLEEKRGEGYEKREIPSTTNFAFLNAWDNDNNDNNEATDKFPFDEIYTLKSPNTIKDAYDAQENQWRNIDKDWLFSAGSLALKYERSVNNTSLAIAIQFIDSEKILLFTGDAELGNWLSWHDGLKWQIKVQNKLTKVTSEYILNNTVFYKVGHHLSQNGTPKLKGLEMMNNEELAAMVPLDLGKMLKCWHNTMPNDYIGAELIRKTKGKLILLGNRSAILKNIITNRVSINKDNLATIDNLNKPFDGKIYIEFEVTG